MVKSRKPMHVDPEFEKRIKDIQKAIRMKKGEEISLRELTAKITKDPEFAMIEKNLIGNPNFKLDLKIKLDRRYLE